MYIDGTKVKYCRNGSLFRNKVKIKIKISMIKWIMNRLKKKMVLINYLTTFI